VHPNDHVNLHQSTNDVYPTACHVAVLRQWPELRDALRLLADAFLAQGERWQGQRRLARTCLQDAVDITFQDAFGAYARFLERATERIAERVDALHAVNLGGTIVGRSNDVPAAYLERIIPALRMASSDAAFRAADNLFDATQNLDDLVAVSSELNLLARGLLKIAKDLRLMASGPEAGFGEIQLPAMQPGSSIMPGKVNPVIPEFTIQCCFQVMGCHAACESAVDHGELDINVWESSVLFNILDAMALLGTAVTTFDLKCVSGLTIVRERNDWNADTITPWLIRLAKRFSYSHLSDVCKEANGDLEGLRARLAQLSGEGLEESSHASEGTASSAAAARRKSRS